MLLTPCAYPQRRRGSKPSGDRFTARNTGSQTIVQRLATGSTRDFALVVIVPGGAVPQIVAGGALLQRTACEEFATTNDLGCFVDTSSGLVSEAVHPVGVSVGFEAQSLGASATMTSAVKRLATPLAPLSVSNARDVGEFAVHQLLKEGPAVATEAIARAYARAASTAQRPLAPGDAFLVLAPHTVWAAGSLDAVVMQGCDPQDAAMPPTGPHGVGWLSPSLSHRSRVKTSSLVETALHLNPVTHCDALHPPLPLPGHRDVLGFTSSYSTAPKRGVDPDLAAYISAAIDPATLLSTGVVCLTGPGAHPALVELGRSIAAETAALPGLQCSARDMDTGATNVSPLMTAPVAGVVQASADVLMCVMNTAVAQCHAWVQSPRCPPTLKAPCMPGAPWAKMAKPPAPVWVFDTRRPLFVAAPQAQAALRSEIDRWCALAEDGERAAAAHSPLGITGLGLGGGLGRFDAWRGGPEAPLPPPAPVPSALLPDNKMPTSVQSMWAETRTGAGMMSVDAICARLRATVARSPQRPRVVAKSNPPPLESAPWAPAPAPPPKPKKKAAAGSDAPQFAWMMPGEARKPRKPAARKPVAEEADSAAPSGDDDAERDAKDDKLRKDIAQWRKKAVRRTVARGMTESRAAALSPVAEPKAQPPPVKHPPFMLTRADAGAVETSLHPTRTRAMAIFAAAVGAGTTPELKTTVSVPAGVKVERRAARLHKQGIPWLPQSRKKGMGSMCPLGSLPSPRMVAKVVARLMASESPAGQMAIAMDIALCLRVVFTSGIMPASVAAAWLDAMMMTTPAVVTVLRRDTDGPFAAPRPLVTSDTVAEWLLAPAKMVAALPAVSIVINDRQTDTDTEAWMRQVWITQASTAIEWALACALRPVGCSTVVAAEGRCLGRSRSGGAAAAALGAAMGINDDPAESKEKASILDAMQKRAMDSLSCDSVLGIAAEAGDAWFLRTFLTAMGRRECTQAVARAVVGALVSSQWDFAGADAVLHCLLSPRGVLVARAAFARGDAAATVCYDPDTAVSAAVVEVIVLRDEKAGKNAAGVLCDLFEAARRCTQGVEMTAPSFASVEGGRAVYVARCMAFAPLCVSAGFHPGGSASPFRISACKVAADGPGTREMEQAFAEVGLVRESKATLQKRFRTTDMGLIRKHLNTSIGSAYLTLMPMPSAVAMVLQCARPSEGCRMQHSSALFTSALDATDVDPAAVWAAGSAVPGGGVLPPGVSRVWGSSMFPPIREAKKAIAVAARLDAAWVAHTFMSSVQGMVDIIGVLEGRVAVAPGGGVVKARRRQAPPPGEEDDDAGLLPGDTDPRVDPKMAAMDSIVLSDDDDDDDPDEIELGHPWEDPPSFRVVSPAPKKRQRGGARRRSTEPAPPKRRRDIVHVLRDMTPAGLQVVLVDNNVVVRTLSGPLGETEAVQRPQKTAVAQALSEGEAARFQACLSMKRKDKARVFFDLWQGDVDNVVWFGWYNEVDLVLNDALGAWQWTHRRNRALSSGFVLTSRCVTPADVALMRETLECWKAELAAGGALGGGGRHDRVPALFGVGLPGGEMEARSAALALALKTIDEGEGAFAAADADVDPDSWRTAPMPETYTRFCAKLQEWEEMQVKPWHVHWRDGLST